MANKNDNPKSEQEIEEASRIEAIPSTSPEARDEGPRLIPLRPSRPEGLAGQKYLELADRALREDHREK